MIGQLPLIGANGCKEGNRHSLHTGIGQDWSQLSWLFFLRICELFTRVKWSDMWVKFRRFSKKKRKNCQTVSQTEVRKPNVSDKSIYAGACGILQPAGQPRFCWFGGFFWWLCELDLGPVSHVTGDLFSIWKIALLKNKELQLSVGQNKGQVNHVSKRKPKALSFCECSQICKGSRQHAKWPMQIFRVCVNHDRRTLNVQSAIDFYHSRLPKKICLYLKHKLCGPARQNLKRCFSCLELSAPKLASALLSYANSQKEMNSRFLFCASNAKIFYVDLLEESLYESTS